jgi:hypothetical protein
MSNHQICFLDCKIIELLLICFITNLYQLTIQIEGNKNLNIPNEVAEKIN